MRHRPAASARPAADSAAGPANPLSRGRQGQPIPGSPGLFRWRGRTLRDPEQLADGSFAVLDHDTGALVYAGVPPPPPDQPPRPRSPHTARAATGLAPGDDGRPEPRVRPEPAAALLLVLGRYLAAVWGSARRARERERLRGKVARSQ